MFVALLSRILLTLAILIVASNAQSSADIAKGAADERDQYIENARAGVRHITNFVANTSACTSLAACEQARQEQSEALRSLTSAAKAATQSSKKAGQAACKFARKAGTKEREAEGARDAAEKVAEHLEDEAEHQADKAHARMESAFEQARRQMKASAAKKVLANDALESLAASRVIPAGVVVGLVLTLSAGILGIFARLRRANVDRSLEQPILSAEGSTCV
jgi:type IV secretory pathway VirB10-like protein